MKIAARNNRKESNEQQQKIPMKLQPENIEGGTFHKNRRESR